MSLAMSHEILASLGLESSDGLPDAPIMAVNTGNLMLIVHLNSASDLRRIHPDFAAIERISQDLDLIGYYVFSLETQKPGRDATVWMFAPHYGIPEESATGMGAGTLACYLHDVLKINKKVFSIEQGYFMEITAPSLLTAELETSDDGTILSLLEGGQGMVMDEKLVELYARTPYQCPLFIIFHLHLAKMITSVNFNS